MRSMRFLWSVYRGKKEYLIACVSRVAVNGELLGDNEYITQIIRQKTGSSDYLYKHCIFIKNSKQKLFILPRIYYA